MQHWQQAHPSPRRRLTEEPALWTSTGAVGSYLQHPKGIPSAVRHAGIDARVRQGLPRHCRRGATPRPGLCSLTLGILLRAPQRLRLQAQLPHDGRQRLRQHCVLAVAGFRGAGAARSQWAAPGPYLGVGSVLDQGDEEGELLPGQARVQDASDLQRRVQHVPRPLGRRPVHPGRAAARASPPPGGSSLLTRAAAAGPRLRHRPARPPPVRGRGMRGRGGGGRRGGRRGNGGGAAVLLPRRAGAGGGRE